MNKIGLKVSGKDIPVPGKQYLRKMLVRRTYEHLIRLRWRVLAHLNPEKFRNTSNSYSFKSGRFPTTVQCDALKKFEHDLWSMVKNIEFRNVNNAHQRRLKDIQNSIKNNQNLIIASDKTSNFYEVNHDTYHRLTNNEITKKYKKCDPTKPDLAIMRLTTP